MLPKSVVKNSEVVELSGGAIEVHSLTFAQVQVAAKAGEEGSNELAIAWATDNPLDEVKEWLKSASAGDVEKLLTAIMTVSGIGEDARFQG